jgi:hypothetical protein
MIIGTTNLVINEIGAIFNVRIEGDTDANLFTTDATNSRVGVGTVSPAEKLDVVGNIKLSGNVIPASGFGIDFSATSHPAGMTSELLADYEEGTWTPTQGTGLTVVGTFFATARYTKIGRVVTVSGYLSGSTTVAAAAVDQLLGGLPFTPVGQTAGIAFGIWTAPAGIANVSTSLYNSIAISATDTIAFQMTYSV